MSSTIDIEEDHGIVKAKIIRSKGDFGRITVDYMTVSQTAGSLPGNVSYFEKVQQLKTVSAYRWHVFSAFGDVYALLASTNRTGSLPSAVDDIGMGEYFGSALFRWQGVLVPVQVGLVSLLWWRKNFSNLSLKRKLQITLSFKRAAFFSSILNTTFRYSDNLENFQMTKWAAVLLRVRAFVPLIFMTRI